MGKLRSLRVVGTRPPQGGVLHAIIRDDFSAYLKKRDEAGKTVPWFVVDEFNRFLRCGDPVWGYAAIACGDCDYDYSTPFSCKRRGFCTRCLVHRREELSRFHEIRVIGDTPVRHWAACMPSPLRYLGGFNERLPTYLVNVCVSRIRRYYRLKAKRELKLESMKDVWVGAVTAIHRISANGSINLHFHSVFADGVFVSKAGGPVEFHEVSAPTPAELAAISWDICRHTVAMLKRRGMWEDAAPVPGDPEGTYTGLVTIGPVKRKRFRFFAMTSEDAAEDPVRRKGASAFTLWAGKRIGRGQRKPLRRLLRYLLSPAIAESQLTRLPDGNVLLTFKRPRRDGSTTRVLTPAELFDILVALTPRRRANLVRLHGIYAPNAARRAEAVPEVSERASAERPSDESAEDRAAYAELLKHVHEEEVRRCPRCRGRLHLLELNSRRVKYQRSRESIRKRHRWRCSEQAAAK